MTYPVDDAGNPRVDFVWGNFPLQPDQGRNISYNNSTYFLDGGWAVKELAGNTELAAGWTELGFPTGDGDSVRFQTFEYGIHDIATTGYSNYPSFIENYAGDGDTGLEAVVPDLKTFAVNAMGDAVVAAGLVYASTTTHVGATTVNDGKIKSQSPLAGVKANLGSTVTATFFNAPEVPNVVGLTESAANTALIAANVVKGAVTTANNAAGATALNDGKVKTQTPAAGTTVNTGASVALVKYAYTVTANTNIAGFSQDSLPGHVALTGNNVYMYLYGRTTKPTAGSTITVAGNANTTLNQNYSVTVVEDNDSYNTGGTIVTLTGLTQAVVNPMANVTIGTWITA